MQSIYDELKAYGFGPSPPYENTIHIPVAIKNHPNIARIAIDVVHRGSVFDIRFLNKDCDVVTAEDLNNNSSISSFNNLILNIARLKTGHPMMPSPQPADLHVSPDTQHIYDMLKLYGYHPYSLRDKLFNLNIDVQGYPSIHTLSIRVNTLSSIEIAFKDKNGDLLDIRELSGFMDAVVYVQNYNDLVQCITRLKHGLSVEPGWRDVDSDDDMSHDAA